MLRSIHRARSGCDVQINMNLQQRPAETRVDPPSMPQQPSIPDGSKIDQNTRLQLLQCNGSHCKHPLCQIPIGTGNSCLRL